MRLLHVSHHDGCVNEIDFVAAQLGFEAVHWRYDDGYNIGPDRAARSWRQHQAFFSQFEWVITSDTAPLSRIFVQNGYPGKIIIWVCNRFDYGDRATGDCGFPDPAYYEQFQSAARRPNVAMVSYTEFEHEYARRAGVEIGRTTIPPTGAGLPPARPPLIPSSVERAGRFFIPPYHNDTILLDLAQECATVGIAAYTGRYSGPRDLDGFAGIIHIPYAWSNFALFENLQRGLPYFVPSRQFLLRLARRPQFFWSPPFVPALLDLAEWYRPAHADVFVYFDSWKDLARKTRETDYGALRRRIAAFCEAHTQEALSRWRAVFAGLGALPSGKADA